MGRKLGPRPKGQTDRIIAGAWCIVDAAGFVVRASRSLSPGTVSFWGAGEGQWTKAYPDPRDTRYRPVHYAGTGPMRAAGGV